MHHMLEDTTEIITEDIQTIMEQMDDPEQMVLQLIREMEEQLNAARQDSVSDGGNSADLKQELRLMGNELEQIKQKARNLSITPKRA